MVVIIFRQMGNVTFIIMWRYQSDMKMFCMLLVVGIVCCYTSQTVGATEGPEVFDIKKGEIVLTLPNSNSLQNQVKNWLSSSVSGIVGALRIEPSEWHSD
jgi:hypothetical protein